MVTFVAFSGMKVKAQSYEAKVLLLDVKKLSQLKENLQNMKQGYEMLVKGYTVVRDLSKGSFQLHEHFLDGLWLASPAVRRYWKIPEIISMEDRLADAAKGGRHSLKNSAYLRPDEISYIHQVEDAVFAQALDDLDDLTGIVTDHQMQLSDAERITGIDRIYLAMQERLDFLTDFHHRASLLVAQRTKEAADERTMKALIR